jgi:signal transduction histidine kinase/DNA-binding response OmpR family regulator
MNNGTKIKKELSCKTLIPIFNAVKLKKLNINKIIEGIPYDLSYLSNKRERIEWYYWCRIISNSRSYFKPSEYEEMGRNYVKSGSYIEAVLASYILFSSHNSSRILSRHFFRMNKKDFTCIKYYMEFPASNKRKVTVYLEDSYEFYPEFIYISKGVAEQIAAQMRHKEFKIETTWIPQGAVFDISWKKENVFFDFKKWIVWLFNFKKAFLYLADSHEELINQNNKLEESKSILQKQATQLKVAYEIATSIRQSLDIKKTLNAITAALVNEAYFSLACIRLVKDLDGASLKIEAFNGVDEKNVKPTKNPIIINNEKIGELIIYPKISMDVSELEELLNYILPIINISIHDSLVLRTITDYKNNLEKKVDLRTAELKKAQSVQNRFFTNISHEFRTPLTLILGSAKQIIEQSENANAKAKEKANLIYRSAKKLNRLANQLLDISRINAGKMKLKAGKQNLVRLINELVLSFESFAERKNICLLFQPEVEKIIIYLDRDKFDKIMSNLLSNAVKFTPKGGKIEITVKLTSVFAKASPGTPFQVGHSGFLKIPSSGGSLRTGNKVFVQISVSDTGIGIPKDQCEKIFDRFYQVDNRLSKEYEGTGVGLSLTKELVELHNGEIRVESEEGKGSTFIIIFPLGKGHLKPDEILDDEEVSGSEILASQNFSQEYDEINLISKGIKNHADINFFDESGKPLLLIVEDNSDLRKFICDILNQYYNIIEVPNGEEGLKKSLELIPDLIISDIMMPKMDGFQLCSKLKTDSRTSHIPLILLTAKTTLQDKIEGFETGADDYIYKPFEADELKARIKNLLDQRKRIHEHFKKYGLFEFENNKVNSVDQKFLKKICETITNNLTEPSFGVDLLAEEMSISKSLLYKKFIALIGEPPGELIKRIRLDKAVQLIEKNSGNITEIAFEVGFNDPSYFTACFKKQFGKTPSQYHNKFIRK